MNASSGMGMVGAIVWMVVLFGIMYFLMLRPQKKEQKRLQAMLNDMEVGDSIVTTGGFYGVVIDMTEEDVIVEFGNNKNCRRRNRTGNRKRSKESTGQGMREIWTQLFLFRSSVRRRIHRCTRRTPY